MRLSTENIVQNERRHIHAHTQQWTRWFETRRMESLLSTAQVYDASLLALRYTEGG